MNTSTNKTEIGLNARSMASTHDGLIPETWEAVVAISEEFAIRGGADYCPRVPRGAG
jgi:hypothetical protein